MNFMADQHSGSRLVGKMSQFGFKHHGIVIGKSVHDGQTYVAESVNCGYQYVTEDEFVSRYSRNGKIERRSAKDFQSGYEIAERAVEEINKGGYGKYNALFNNCESFANRAVHGHSISWQFVTVCLVIVAGVAVLKGARAA